MADKFFANSLFSPKGKKGTSDKLRKLPTAVLEEVAGIRSLSDRESTDV
jgi:hypothetical protein